MSSGASLVPFGFTALESDIYVFLLKESPATGYRIAQGIGKPAANTYKAIQTLQAKGAILVEEGPSRSCRAVPLDELMNRLQKDFEARRKDTEKRLKAIGKSTDDDRIYQLRSRDQILTRIREMLAGASQTALLKLPTFAVRAMEGDLENAADRGVAVALLTGESMTIEGVSTSTMANELADCVVVVTDSAQLLMGLLRTDEECEAMWTMNLGLSQVQHVGLSSEIAFAQVAHMLAIDEKRGRMVKAVENRIKLPQNRQE